MALQELRQLDARSNGDLRAPMQLLRPPAPEGLERTEDVVSSIVPATWRVSRRCSETEVDVICRPRANAMRRGDFRWDRQLRAWIDRARPLRSMSSRTKYFVYSERADAAHVDHTGEPIQIWDCPWCGVELPSLSPARPDSAASLTQGDGAD